MAAYRYLVTGRVQGVGYRYFAVQEARRLGVTGFARNLPDGSVEVIAEGADDALSQFEEALRSGPSFAAVQNVDRAPAPSRGDAGFHVR
jgi:acylphosphatase